jgi:hypothetical protein
VRSRRLQDAVIGVSDHGGWAVLVTADGDGRLVDRRRVELVDAGLPKIPHHVEAQGLPIDEAVALIERVRDSAERRAKLVLEEVAASVSARIVGIALRECPELPPTIAERITNYRARNVADWVMYRRALAGAAENRGWAVDWYDSRRVFDIARASLGMDDFDGYFGRLRKSIGPPWGQDQKLALAAGVAAWRK